MIPEDGSDGRLHNVSVWNLNTPHAWTLLSGQLLAASGQLLADSRELIADGQLVMLML
jgi:hypothetical protein